MPNPDPITHSHPLPTLIAAPGSPGGPCDARKKNNVVLAAAYAYGATIAPSSVASAADVARAHATLFNALHAPVCEHARCAQLRQQAAAPCVLCGEQLGYDEPFVPCDGGAFGQHAHEACAAKQAESEAA